MPIRVLIVDDSALIRQVLKSFVDDAEGMCCVGVARDAFEARDKVNELAPDVITLDIEMPRMDGLAFLQKLMRARPTPVVMISTLTERGADATLRAMELGAVDFIAKPKLDVRSKLADYQQQIIHAIQGAAHAKLASKHLVAKRPRKLISELSAIAGTEKIIAIGASTGGTEAIKAVLEPLPASMPAIVITQHMPGGFTRSFAARLNSLCAMSVKEAEHGERIIPGRAYIAPGGYHLEVRRNGANYTVHLSEEAPVNRHRPSVDVMFDSLARTAGKNVAAVLLTGMGRDGAEGLKRLKAAGALTIAQDQETSLVYGMPKAAADIGAASEILALDQVAEFLADWACTHAAHVRV